MDQVIREDPPEVRTGSRWVAEKEVEKAEVALKHRDIVGAVQSGRQGLGVNSFKPFCQSSDKERRDAVVREVRRQEQEKGCLHLVGLHFELTGGNGGHETWLEGTLEVGASQNQFPDQIHL